MASNLTPPVKLSDITGLQSFDITPDVKYIDPMSTPIQSLIRNRGQVSPSTSVEFKWHEGDYKPVYTQANGGFNDSTTSITVDDNTHLNIGDLICNIRTRELMRVTAKPASTTLTVVRGVGESAGVTGLNDDYLVLSGDAQQEYFTTPDNTIRSVDQKSNYIQTIVTTIDISDLRQLTDSAMGPGMREQDLILRQSKEHVRKMEHDLILGKKASFSSGGKQIYTTAGLLKTITTNVNDNGSSPGTITKPNFDLFLAQCFTYGNPKKVLVAGSGIMKAIGLWANTAILQYQPAGSTENTLGIQVTNYLNPYGSGNLEIIHHPMLNQMQMSTYGFILDLENIYIRTLNGDTKINANIQSAKDHGSMHEILSYVGWQIMNEKTHGVIYNVTGGA